MGDLSQTGDDNIALESCKQFLNILSLRFSGSRIARIDYIDNEFINLLSGSTDSPL